VARRPAILDPRERVRFDADGSGPRDWTWITPEAGWLVHDADGAGTIDSALQLFGSVTFWLFWSNGYEPMQECGWQTAELDRPTM
jgi:hypothetical protein